MNLLKHYFLNRSCPKYFGNTTTTATTSPHSRCPNSNRCSYTTFLSYNRSNSLTKKRKEKKLLLFLALNETQHTFQHDIFPEHLHQNIKNTIAVDISSMPFPWTRHRVTRGRSIANAHLIIIIIKFWHFINLSIKFGFRNHFGFECASIKWVSITRKEFFVTISPKWT